MTVGIRNTASYVSAASETTLVVPVPSGVQDGDVMFLAVFLTASSGSITTPGGWTPIYANSVPASSTSSHASLFWRVAASEPGSYSVTVSSGRGSASIVALTGVDTTTPLDATDVAVDSAAGLTVTAPSVTAAAATMLLSWFGGRVLGNGYLATWTPDGAETEQVDVGSAVAATSNSSHELATQDVSSGATGTRAAVAGGTGVTTINWIAYSVVVKPAAGGGGGPGSGSLEIASLTAALSSTESGAAADAGTPPVADLAASDSAVATEAASVDSGSTPQTGSDAAVATDTAVLTVDQAASEAGTGAEAAGVGVAGAEAATGADTATLAVARTATDAGAGAEAATLASALLTTEAGTGADTAASRAAALAGSDAGTGADTATLAAAVSGSDSGIGADTAALAAALAATESSAGDDTASVAIDATFLTASDSGTATDTSVGTTAALAATEAGAAVDTSGLTALLAGSDTGAGAEATAIWLTAFDAAVGSDGAVVTSSTVLAGYTRDSTGAVIPNVTVDVFVAATNAYFGTVTSDGAGHYSIAVDPGVAYFMVAYSLASDVYGATARDIMGE